MNRRIIIVVSLTLSVSLAAQAPQPDAEGNYRWTYRDASGVQREFSVLPGKWIEPNITIAISRTTDDRFLYDYRFENGATAKQEIGQCFADVEIPTSVTGIPDGWEVRSPTRVVPRTAWRSSGSGMGLPPGAAKAGFQLTSAHLPGLTHFKCRARVPLAAYPADLPPTIRAEAEQVMASELVNVLTLGPMIVVDVEPSSKLVINRILRNFRPVLAAGDHPSRDKIIAALDSARDASERTDRSALRRALTELIDLVTAEPERLNHRLLSVGLRASINEVLGRIQ